MTSRSWVRFLGVAVVLTALNFYLCHELFLSEYLNNLQSNEGMLATLGKFFAEHLTAGWFPLWNAGIPRENTYAPLVPLAIAAISKLTSASPVLAMHFLSALIFCLVPIAWSWIAWRWGAGLKAVFAAGLVYSLTSPTALLFGDLRTDLEFPTDSRRLIDVVHYGDITHMAALALLPLALFAIERALTKGKVQHYLAAIALCALTVLSNAFGVTALALGTIALVASLARNDLSKAIWRTALIGVVTYLLVCPVLTPSVISSLARNSPASGGNYSLSIRAITGWGIILSGLVAGAWIARQWTLPRRFVLLLGWMFFGFLLLYFVFDIPLAPQPHRYHLEADIAIAFLAGLFIFESRGRTQSICLILLIAIAVPQTIRMRRLDRALLAPLNFRQTSEYRVSSWIGENLPHARVMVSGDTRFWFNLVADNPQFSGGHDPYAPNFIQRVAVYTIYSDANAGSRAAEYSIFWLKAFGAFAIHVQRAPSGEHYHPFVNPDKFEGVLTKLWEREGDAVYAVPARSPSLAHVIPVNAIVKQIPKHGLDIAPGEAYVRALDDPSIPEAELLWDSTDKARIQAVAASGQVISVQMTYDPGWEATSGQQHHKISSDGLGMMVIEPGCTSPCEITLEFTGGLERKICRMVSYSAMAALALWAIFRRLRNRLATRT